MTTEIPKISVIMLTHNRENLVGRAIHSIQAQTFTGFEYIIVDNGSTDKSGEICDRFAEKDKRIHVVHRNGGNIGSGRNVGLGVATGQYITFIDDDDYAEPDMLEFLYNLVIENNAQISICGSTNKAFDEKRVMGAEEALIELMWRKFYNTAFPTKLFTRELGNKIKFSEDDKYDDISQMYKLLANAERIAYYGTSKYTFYRHPGNNSAWTTNYNLLNKETLEEYLRVYHKRTKWLSEKFPSHANIWNYFEWSFMISMVDKINRYDLLDCKKQYNILIEQLRIHRKEFLNCHFILDFEKEWMEKYI